MMRVLKLVVVALAMMSLSSSVLPRAMALKGMKPPEGGTPILQWIVTLLFAAVCAAIMFKNAKRTHQD